jgi:hypothetical protein
VKAPEIWELERTFWEGEKAVGGVDYWNGIVGESKREKLHILGV